METDSHNKWWRQHIKYTDVHFFIPIRVGTDDRDHRVAESRRGVGSGAESESQRDTLRRHLAGGLEPDRIGRRRHGAVTVRTARVHRSILGRVRANRVVLPLLLPAALLLRVRFSLTSVSICSARLLRGARGGGSTRPSIGASHLGDAGVAAWVSSALRRPAPSSAVTRCSRYSDGRGGRRAAESGHVCAEHGGEHRPETNRPGATSGVKVRVRVSVRVGVHTLQRNPESTSLLPETPASCPSRVFEGLWLALQPREYQPPTCADYPALHQPCPSPAALFILPQTSHRLASVQLPALQR
eukprot:scaffold24336_cov57-Phaeocystis_antarctica.AAC.2